MPIPGCNVDEKPIPIPGCSGDESPIPIPGAISGKQKADTKAIMAKPAASINKKPASADGQTLVLPIRVVHRTRPAPEAVTLPDLMRFNQMAIGNGNRQSQQAVARAMTPSDDHRQ